MEHKRYNERLQQEMTVNERRLNDHAFKAQQRKDLNEIPYKLPGIKRYGDERQDKIIE